MELRKALQKMNHWISVVDDIQSGRDLDMTLKSATEKALFWAEIVKALSLAELAKNNDGWSS